MNESNVNNKSKHKRNLRGFLKSSIIIRFLFFIADWVYRKIERSLTAFVFTGYEKCEAYYKRSLFHSIFQGYERGILKNIVRNTKKRIIISTENSAIINGIKGCADNFLAMRINTIGAFLVSFGFYSSLMYLLKIFVLDMSETLAIDLIAGVSLIVFGGILCFGKQSVYNVIYGSKICNVVLFRTLGFSPKRDKTFGEQISELVNLKKRNIIFFLVGMIFGILTYLVPPVYICVAIVGIVMLYAVLCHPEGGFFAILFALPFLPTMVLAGMCIWVSVCYFLKLMRGKRTFNFEIFDLFVLMFCGLIFFGGFVSVSRTGSIRPALLYLCFTLIYFIGVNMIRTKEIIMRCVTLMAVSGFLVAIYGILQNHLGLTGAIWHDAAMFDIGGRVMSTFENPNVLGKYLIMIIPFFVVAIVLFKRTQTRLLYTAGLLCMCMCLVYTWSRGSWLAFIIATMVLLLILERKVLAIYMAGILALPFAPLILPDAVTRRFLSIGNIADTSTSYRVSIWQGTIRMLREHFFTGIGIGIEPFSIVYPEYALSGIETAPHSHSLYLQVLVEYGIVGIAILSLIIFFFIQCCFCAMKKADEIYLKLFAAAGFCAVGGFLINGMTDFVWYNYRVYLMFWLVIAVTVGICRFALRNQPIAMEAMDKIE